MSLKMIGAICVIFACGGCGLAMKSQHIGKIHGMQNLISALDYMECELQYRCTPLPQLCRQAGEQSKGKIRQIFCLMADELDAQISPDVQRCMSTVLDKIGNVEIELYSVLMELGDNLGKFDMAGQLRGLENMRYRCREKLDQLTKNSESRMRSYQTLGLCAGAAIAILLV